jgi:hypothetical protein
MKKEREMCGLKIKRRRSVFRDFMGQGHYLQVTTPCGYKGDLKLEILGVVFEQIKELWGLDAGSGIFERLARTLKARCADENKLRKLRLILNSPGHEELSVNKQEELLALIRRLEDILEPPRGY